MEQGHGDPQWDASLPGAGAERVTVIVQLYFRMMHYSPLTILVADALCLVFGADGATRSELVDYLGLAEERVSAGLEAIPPEMRCTSVDMEVVADETVAPPSGGQGPASSPTASDPGEKAEPRHYLNYRGIVPLAFAHVAQALLALAATPLPASPYTEQLQQASAARRRTRSRDDTAPMLFLRAEDKSTHALSGPYASGNSSTTPGASPPPPTSASSVSIAALNVSPALRQSEALEGIFCPVCRFYFALADFAATVCRCPTCGNDVLRATVLALKERLDQQSAANGGTNVTFLQHTKAPSVMPPPPMAPRRAATAAKGSTAAAIDGGRAVLDTSRAPLSSPTVPGEAEEVVSSPVAQIRTKASTPMAALAATVSSPTARGGTAVQGLDCPLAKDPFLVQQALAFLYLYHTPFACVTDARCVISVEDILTEAEYERRLRGKATVADQFRAVHRHPNSIRVKLVSQAALDKVMRETNAKKIAKRANLPPWLRPRHSISALGTGTTTVPGIPFTRGGKTLFSEAENAEVTADSGDAIPSKRPREEEGASTRQTPATATVKKRNLPTAQDVQRTLTSTARFVAQEFYEDDYDAVPLPCNRIRVAKK